MEAKLTVLEGKHKGCEIPLPATMFLIGRDPKCHLRPHCRLVSRLHCAIACWAGHVQLRDLKSGNGTFLNDQRIHGQVVVKDGDILRVGTITFAFGIRADEPVPAPTRALSERTVSWLLAEPTESGLRALADRTSEQVLSTPPVQAAEGQEGTATRQDQAHGTGLSAGEYLHEYFHQRKRGFPPPLRRN
jgi:pSer/pThr/pTyr-binding forkhead associated (FHA) protein